MTAEQKNKISWLQRAREADRKAQALRAKLEQDRSLAERINRNHLTTGGTCSGNSTEDALIRLAETERHTQEKLAELVRIREEVASTIEKIPEPDLQTILVWRYLKYLTFEKISENMHYDERTIRRKHIQALDKIVR